MKIAYIMTRFPLLSETFILREMIEIEKQGSEIALFPLICQQQEVIHPEVENWIKRCHCYPYFSSSILRSTVRTFIQQPFKFLIVFLSIIFWNLPSPKFLIRAIVLFPKATLMAEKIQAENIDHIHVHYASHPALVAYIIHKFTGIPYSVTMHSHDIYDNHVMLRQKLESAKFLVTISNYNVNYLANLLGNWVTKKITVIHCGVNTEEYKPSARIKKTDFKLIQIGSLHWKKGQIFLLKAIKALISETDDFQVQIIGEGPERKKLEKIIRELEIGKWVTLLGPKTQDEIKSLLPTADCYLQTSISEGIPVALMEALACELPVISTNITGIPELVIDGKTGILIPPKDEQKIVEAIKFIKINSTLARTFGREGRKHVESNFNLQKNINSLHDLFIKMNQTTNGL